ncbi:sarcosine oxidase subunit delta [Actinomycetospora lemnae]|uniref:Sarcosine oxidase subunit delta n=1 Tax=Actinomycetospora lemnae TaxID=3019891 RepID=A0ABT5T1E7_9PSEU|nr:sarcosine oxidase subunit delta [Actinomycetospora sp. DW7H6]MDD7968939.1 sarcosine oxidase subunit delta [Actinomycetospora sp. DW7H6]
MMLLPCPWCGPRNATEFRFVGEAGPRPDPATVTPEQWRHYLYVHANRCGWSTETWYHRAGCRRYLSVERHTLTHEIRTVRDTATGTTSASTATPEAAR